MYCSSAVMILITSADPPVNEQDSFQTEAAVGNILRKWGVRGWGATQLGSGMPDKSKHTQEERVGGWASKNLSPIKGNINIINPVIMVYVSIFLRFPRAIITLNHKSALNYLIRGSPLGQEWITGTNLDNSLHTVQVTPRKLTSETSIRPKLLVRNVLVWWTVCRGLKIWNQFFFFFIVCKLLV